MNAAKHSGFLNKGLAVGDQVLCYHRDTARTQRETEAAAEAKAREEAIVTKLRRRGNKITLLSHAERLCASFSGTHPIQAMIHSSTTGANGDKWRVGISARTLL